MDARTALNIWGLCHQLRLDEDDSKLTKAGRRRDRIEAIRRNRDMLVEWYSQYVDESGQRKGQLTPKARERVKSVKARCDAEISRIRSLGFSAPLISSNDLYVRGAKAMKPQVNPESGIALAFIIVEDYLAKRPMQRALAWQVYVLGKSVRSFRYSEEVGQETHCFCGSGSAAGRVHLNLKRRLDFIFEED